VLRAGVNIDGWAHSSMTRTWFFDNPKEGTFFWKQFLVGIFLVVATTGLDQDLMQRTLSCKNSHESQKNIIVGAMMQIVVIGLFLFLGFLLYTYADQSGIPLVNAAGIPLKGDEVFPFLATGEYFPVIVGVLFIIGFIAAAYSAAGSALTALTTSFTVDILNKEKANNLTQIRTLVHICMAVLMAVCIYVIHILNNDSVIQTVYKVASYTYGPLLGMFCFGIFTKKQVHDRWIPISVILAPILTWIIDINSADWFNGYVFSHERLILNALFTFIGMICLIKNKNK
jgi:Na+/proline symporter